MLTKPGSPGKKPTRRKAVASAAPELTDSAAIVVLESDIDPDIRRQLVATEAYFLAERRGFTAGNELEDWVAAEKAVDSRLYKVRVA
jgi:hypothetical protein